MKIENDGLISGNPNSGQTVLRQKLERLLPGTYTYSILISEISGVFHLFKNAELLNTITVVGLHSVTFTISSEQSLVDMSVLTGSINNNMKIQAIKLELGTKQTLAHQDSSGNWVLNDPPPNYQQELLKCQRYYLSYPFANRNIFSAFCDTDHSVSFTIPTPVIMRVIPSMKVASFGSYFTSDGADVALNGNAPAIGVRNNLIFVILSPDQNVNVGSEGVVVDFCAEFSADL